MRPVRLGAVDYLNARPLVYGLELRPDASRCGSIVPSKCAALLHEGSIDVGMIPSHRVSARRGRTASCRTWRSCPTAGRVGGAVHHQAARGRADDRRRHQLADVERAAARAVLRARSASSRSSCRWRRDPAAMLRRCDAALVIGDAALFLDHAGGRRREDRSGRAVDGDDRAAVRLGVLGRPARGAARRARRRAGRRRATPAWPPPTRSPRRTAGPSAPSSGSAT